MAKEASKEKKAKEELKEEIIEKDTVKEDEIQSDPPESPVEKTEAPLSETKDDERLAQAEAQRDEYLSALQRERADFENYKKRNAGLRETAYQDGVSDTVEKILPILDNFERALDSESTDQAFADGILMILRQLQDAMTALGVEEISTEGKFDPTLHNAVMQAEDENKESNDIAEVLQKGYSRNGKVLRHSIVKVVK